MSPLLLGHGPEPRDVFFYYRGAQLYAARKGPFKAHFITRPAYGAEHAREARPAAAVPPGPRSRRAIQRGRRRIPTCWPTSPSEVERHRATVVPVKSQFEETIDDR